MRYLFLFLWKYNFFISFLLLEILCGYLIVQNNNFQRASFINSTNQVAAKVNSAVSSVTEYINLGITNDALSRENAAFKSSVRTAVKNVETAVANKNLEQAQEALKLACTKLDKALAKGIFHKNFVSRNKSRLAKLLNSLA